MLASLLVFIVVLPAGIYYCYTKPKYTELFFMTFALMSCSIFSLFKLPISDNADQLSAVSNIDFLTTASITKKNETSDKITSTLFNSNLEKNNLDKEKIAVDCNDCGFPTSTNPEYFKKPPLSNFRWPIKGTKIKSYTICPDDHNGVDITVPIGTNVHAIDNGTIAYANEDKGYGKGIIVGHDNGFKSVYAYNSEIKVTKGDRVYRGQVIAKSGQNHRTLSPELYFKLTRGIDPVDPIVFIPHDKKFFKKLMCKK